MSIECIKFTPVERGSMLGFADIFVKKWGVEIRGCRVMLTNGKKWVALPSKEYEEGGEKKYAPILKFREKEHSYAFSDQVMAAIEPFIVEAPKVVEFQGDDEPLPF